MLSISVELLTGRYSATAFNDRSATEWPPHPARLFSALVSTWADGDVPDPDERAALNWLETQGPPELSCSSSDQVARRAPVTVFVPVNDPTTLTRDVHRSSYEAVDEAQAILAEADGDRAHARATTKLVRVQAKSIADAHKAATATGTETAAIVGKVIEVLPEYRSKQARSFPTVVPDDPQFWVSWPSAEPSEAQVAALDGLCSRLARLGHSSSFVSCRATDDAPPQPTLVPGASAGLTLRVPRGGLIDRLERDFVAHGGRVEGPLPAGSAVYGRPGASNTDLPVPLLGGDWVILTIPRPLGPGGIDSLPVTRSLEVARAVRGALLAHGADPVPEILSGHESGAVPSAASQHPHLAVVPLPNVIDRRSDGALLGVALVLPAATGSDDRQVVESALSAWSDANGLTLSVGSSTGRRGMRFAFESARLDPAPGGDSGWQGVSSERRATLRRSTWSHPSRLWVTVTPIALDRFPGDIGSSRPEVRAAAENEASATVLRACTYAGLPEPIDVEVDLVSFLSAVPAANRRGRRSGFPSYSAGRSALVRLGVHARLRFADPIAGPVLIGAGRYFGYGLCLPMDSKGRRP